MKRPWLVAAILLLFIGGGAAFFGLRTSFERIITSAEIREKRRAEGKTESYLTEVQSANRPAIMGVGMGGLCLVGSISAFVVHRTQVKGRQKKPIQPRRPKPRAKTDANAPERAVIRMTRPRQH